LELMKGTTVGELLMPVDDFLMANGQNPDEDYWDFNITPYEITTSTPLNVAIDLMLKEDVQFVPIIEEDKVKGILALTAVNDYLRRAVR